MDKLKDIRSKFHNNLPIIIGICLFLYFSYHSISGHRSYSHLIELNQTLEEKKQKLQLLDDELSQLKNKVRMMRPNTLSADMLSEQINIILGYYSTSDIVVISD